MSGIVVGVDGSSHSHNALDWAIDESALRRAPLTVLAVVPVASSIWGVSPLRYPADEDRRAEVQQSIEETVHKAVASHGGQAAVTVRVITGLPADELIKASADADLMVVGARGMGGFGRLLLGSVSSQVSHHAHCPLVVVPGERAH
jgi:nucleotide-binding universal stress UspA family protein